MESKSNLLVHQMSIGPADNFIYLIGDTETKEMASVDPAWDVPFILAEAERLGYTITSVLLTHGHGDHTNGLTELLESHPVPVYISRNEAAQFRPDVDGMIDLDDGDSVTLGSLILQVIHTPGHSPGGLCFLYKDQILVGDTLFIDGCGRCDLPGSDVEAMYHSIHKKLMPLPDNTRIYVGHNYGPAPVDTIGGQKKTNRFMLASTKEAFIKERMG